MWRRGPRLKAQKRCLRLVCRKRIFRLNIKFFKPKKGFWYARTEGLKPNKREL